MKRFIKVISAALAIGVLSSSLGACTKENGLYTWYGKMNVENVLTLTLDMGEGERETLVPFDIYRTVFLYYAGNVPDVTTVDGKLHKTTDEEKTTVAKKMTDESLLAYYTSLECARDLGIDVDKILTKDYSEIYKTSSADGEGDELYAEMLDSLSMTHEYFTYNCQKSELEKAIKGAVASDIVEYTERNYYHYKKILITYELGDENSRRAALAEAQSVIDALDSGEDFDVFVEKYKSEGYENERYVDINGNIVGGGTLSGETFDTVRTLDIGEYSEITEEIYDDIGAFAIIAKEGIELSFLCGSDDTASVLYCYQSATYSEYTPHYLAYATILDVYKQNTAIEPVDEKVYSHIAVDTLY